MKKVIALVLTLVLLMAFTLGCQKKAAEQPAEETAPAEHTAPADQPAAEQPSAEQPAAEHEAPAEGAH